MYGLLGFVQALELVFIQAVQFVLGLGLIVLEWILCHKLGAPVPSAIVRQILVVHKQIPVSMVAMGTRYGDMTCTRQFRLASSTL